MRRKVPVRRGTTRLGRVTNMDYKTKRQPGHVQLMNVFFHGMTMRDRRAQAGAMRIGARYGAA